MYNLFTSIQKNLKLEIIKKKRSGIFTLSIVLGAIIPFIFFTVHLFRYSKGIKEGTGVPENYYFETLKDGLLIGFTHFLFPILIIICASKIAQIDHKNRGWSLMETQPTTKASIYFSKYLILLASNCIAILSLLLSVVFFAFLLSVFFEIPSYKIVSVPFGDFFRIGTRLFIVSLGVTAIQYMLSVLISSFIWPIIIGFISMSIPAILNEFQILMNWYPFQQLADVGVYPKGSDLGSNWFTFSDALSILYAGLFLFIGYSWYFHKTFVRTFFTSVKRSAILVGVVAVLGGLMYYTASPKQQVRSDKTIIKGITSGNMPIKNIYILDVLVQDTLAKIPVVDGEFRCELPEGLPFDAYFILIENYHRQKLFFGEKDSIYIDFKIVGLQKEIEIKGTRLAENMEAKSNRHYSVVSNYLKGNIRLNDDAFYVKRILKEWEDQLEKVNNIRTVDNYIPGDDYLARQYKTKSLEYLGYWNRYQKKVKKVFPDKIIKERHKMEGLENSVTFNDASLLSSGEYLKSALKHLIEKDERMDVSDSQKHFEAIDKLEPSLFKDRLFFKELKTNIVQATEIKKRDSLIDRYLTSIEKKSYKDLLLKELEVQNRLTKGKIAPDFIAKDTKGMSFSLNDFKGKYLLIDIWGNWCPPCLQIAPQFKKKALAYKNKNIVFAKMNFRDNRATWKISSKEKDTLLLDLKPQNENLFVRNYNIKKYPTFILIDPEGKLVSSDFIRPDAKLFDEMLTKYLDK